MVRHYLDFERPLMELEREHEELQRFAPRDEPRVRAKIERLEKRIVKVREEIYSQLTPWQRTQLSRHIDRPHMLDYVELIFDDFIELHGDRGFMDDPAIVGGFARLDGDAVVVVGHQKGKDMKEMGYRNFGMPHPEGYRKALRIMELGARFRKPIIAGNIVNTDAFEFLANLGVDAIKIGQGSGSICTTRMVAGIGVPQFSAVAGAVEACDALGIPVIADGGIKFSGDITSSWR